MRHLAGGLAVSALLAGCGGSGERTMTSSPTSPTRVPQAEQIVAQSGCFACHRLGAEGNDGPGPPLTHIGARLSAAQIREAMVVPIAPMPSFRNLPAERLDALVAYLSGLR